jgi:hypothetical protein
MAKKTFFSTLLNTKDRKIGSDRIFLPKLFQRQLSYQRKKNPLKNEISTGFLFSTDTKSSENENEKKVEKNFFLSIDPCLKSDFLKKLYL